MNSSKGRRKVRVVEVSGNSYEMGLQYGKACPEIRKMRDIIFQLFGGRDKAVELAKKFVPMYLPAAEEYAPEIIEEMKGMAAGAELDFQDIFFLNINYEISVPTVMGCTSFAISGEATNDGEVIAGQNFDFVNMWEENLVLLKMKPAHGPNILAIGPLGALGLIGLNSAGISLNLNLLRNKDSLMPNGGVPSHIILRKLLMSENLGEAIGTIASAAGRSAKNYLLTSDQGDIVDVEVTVDDLDIQYAEEGIITHANYFKADRFKSTDLAALFWPDAYIRCQRLFQLMKNHHGRLSVDVMQQLLQDHNNYPSSICRHPNPKSPLPMGRLAETLVSIISCPRKRKAYIALGNPCENEYLEYQL
jgi:isopenicillin-N N-acyltransferase-like protein